MYIIQRAACQSQIKDWRRSLALPEGTSARALRRAVMHLFEPLCFRHYIIKDTIRIHAFIPTLLRSATLYCVEDGEFREFVKFNATPADEAFAVGMV